jgi:hypothetical protein
MFCKSTVGGLSGGNFNRGRWVHRTVTKEQRNAVLKESLAGPSPYERAAEIAPTHADARLMRRMQDSNFREVRRVTNLLLKLKRYERKMETMGGAGA